MSLELHDVWFSYGAAPAVRGVSLSIEPGETVALLGPNGAGKTTLTKLIMALLRPSRGEIRVAGISSRRSTPEDVATVAAYVFQHPGQQLFARTVLDEVLFAPRQLGNTESEAQRIAAAALRDVGLERRRDMHPYDLPAPERKLVTLAAALAQQPQFLILDEPTQGLDRVSRERVHEIIQKLVSKKTAVFAVTHDLTLVAEAFERTVVMKDGAVVADEASGRLLAGASVGGGAELTPPPAVRLSLALELPGRPVRVRDVVAALRKL